MLFFTLPNPKKKVAQLTAMYIQDQIKKDFDTLLLLSGGSAIEIYDLITDFWPSNINLSKLTISLCDERWDENPDHINSNWKSIQETNFYKYVTEHGAKTYKILNGKSIETEAENFNSFLNKTIINDSQILLLLGMGEDGHTSGILPHTPGLDSKDYAISYHIDNSEINPHLHRITTTTQFIQKSNKIFLYITGEKKRKTLKKVMQLDKEYPTEEWKKNVKNYPILSLSGINDVEIYSDLKLIN